jgi:hypothetical protein
VKMRLMLQGNDRLVVATKPGNVISESREDKQNRRGSNVTLIGDAVKTVTGKNFFLERQGKHGGQSVRWNSFELQV